MTQKNTYRSLNKMQKSTPICSICNSERSLCTCCETENIVSDKNWHCEEKGCNSFLNQCIFCEGRHLCNRGANPDCIYRYKNDCVIAIEIKDQPENSIDYKNLVKKIKNYYNYAITQGLIPSLFVLQLSGLKNKYSEENELQESCEYGLGLYGLTVGQGKKLFGFYEESSHINCKFIVVKCPDFTETKFLEML